MRSPGGRFDYGTCMFTTRLDNGYFGVQPDRHGGQDAGGPAVEMMSPFGLFGRPQDPDLDQDGNLKAGANALVMEHGGEEFVMPCVDLRWGKLLPDPGKGGSGLYAATKIGGHLDVTTIVLSGDDGSIKLKVPFSNGSKSNQFEVTDTSIKATHADGPSLELSSTGVDAGGPGGAAVMLANAAMASYFTALNTALTALGHPVPPPVSYAATKVRAV